MPIGDLTRSDLDELISRSVPEGICLEYKREWVPDKIARAVTAMANNVGGTVIVGMETEDLLPTHLCGFSTRGDPAEMVVQVIRDHVAPVPPFRTLSLSLDSETKCLIVEIDEGPNPPYVLAKTGQIVIRTPTSSAPATREEVELLFAKGERGRRWAEGQLSTLRPVMTANGEVHLLTVPSVDRGLGLNPTLFRNSVLSQIDERTPTPFAHGEHERRWDLQPDRAVVLVEFPGIHGVETYVSTAGVVHTKWRTLSQLPDSTTGEALLREGLPRHARILEEVFGYRGAVFVAFGGHLAQGAAQSHHFHPWIYRGPVELPTLSEPHFEAELRREMHRSVGRPEYEPE
jgi:hypothetical protein